MLTAQNRKFDITSRQGRNPLGLAAGYPCSALSHTMRQNRRGPVGLILSPLSCLPFAVAFTTHGGVQLDMGGNPAVRGLACRGRDLFGLAIATLFSAVDRPQSSLGYEQ